MAEEITSGDVIIDKLFSWVVRILHNHPIILSKNAFTQLVDRNQKPLPAICVKGLIKEDTPEIICLNPATSFAEQQHSLFHEGMHLLFGSLEDEFIGQRVAEDLDNLEREITELEEYIWSKFSDKQKMLLGQLIKERRRINPPELPARKKSGCHG